MFLQRQSEFTHNFSLAYFQVCITDPDLIEKSNLNRQFLFRPHHIQVNTRYSFEYICLHVGDYSELSQCNHTPVLLSQKSKSSTAAEATREINPDLCVDSHLNKVCPATENVYSDTFYSRLNLVVTALDNVEARRYVDRWLQIT